MVLFLITCVVIGARDSSHEGTRLVSGVPECKTDPTLVDGDKGKGGRGKRKKQGVGPNGSSSLYRSGLSSSRNGKKWDGPSECKVYMEAPNYTASFLCNAHRLSNVYYLDLS